MRHWILFFLLAMQLGLSADAQIGRFIPVFGYGIFYNLDMEINPGTSLTINGRVHSNDNIYATGASLATPLIFSTNVEAVQNIYLSRSPLDPLYGSSGRQGSVIFSITNNNPQTNVAPLYLPFVTNANPANPAAAILGLPPAGTLTASPAGQSYLYNEADIIVSNSATTNLSVYYQNLNNANPQTLVPMDVANTYYSFVTNVTYYDYRESKTVTAVQFDVAKFNAWLTNAAGGLPYNIQNTSGGTSKGHDLNIVYIYNGITNNNSQLPAVRVVNGARLPAAGLTVATPFPLYVLGDYNTTTNGINFSTTLGDTTNTVPAALMGDALTILSANWSDAYIAYTSLSSRAKPGNTTINAACLEGIVPSNGSQYSGGVENFLRLLEDWGGVTLAYNGSIVVLFTSQYATGFWNGNYYGVPTRRWGFDSNFLNLAKLPPGTPMLVNPYSLSTNNRLEGPAAGSDSVGLAAIGAWTATNNAAWLHFSFATAIGAGNWNVFFTFDANTNNATRTGTLTFASQTLTVTQTAVLPPALTDFTILSNGAFQFGFTNNQGASFTVWSSTNLALPLTNWTVLGSLTNNGSGQYQFTDLTSTNGGQCFYRVSSP